MREEIELKFRIPEEVWGRLREKGFRTRGKRELERNWLFDDAKQSLRGSGRILRLRETRGRWLLTAKGARKRGKLKRRVEAQTWVEDGAACREALGIAGFRVAGQYQVWRTTLRRKGESGEIAWDETAKGTFLEIEGTAAWVRRTARELGLKIEEAEQRSYPELLIARRPKDRRRTARAS